MLWMVLSAAGFAGGVLVVAFGVTGWSVGIMVGGAASGLGGGDDRGERGIVFGFGPLKVCGGRKGKVDCLRLRLW